MTSTSSRGIKLRWRSQIAGSAAQQQRQAYRWRGSTDGQTPSNIFLLATSNPTIRC